MKSIHERLTTSDGLNETKITLFPESFDFSWVGKMVTDFSSDLIKISKLILSVLKSLENG